MTSKPRLRSQLWFDNPDNPGMTALYLERYLNYGLTKDELCAGKPIIGIAQTGSDLAPCNRHHIELARRVRDGIRDAGGIAFEFPVHPIQETGKRPTAALDRNLAYLGLVEVLYGYPLDGVVLMTGCDKTTPACLMAAATVNLPAIVLSGGPMLNGWWKGERSGSGTAVWNARQEHAAGRIDYKEFIDIVASSAPSAGHCNTMGTASTMNALAEALGMSLPGCAAIPAPYRERAQMAYQTGLRAVAIVHEDLKPSDILTRKAFENAIVACSAIGGSTNAPIHINAIARHAGVKLGIADWEKIGLDIPLLVDMQPAGKYLGEEYFRAGGLPAVMHELLAAKRIHANDVPKMIRAIEVCLLTGRSLSEVHRAGRARLEGYAPIKIGLQPPRAALYDRIEQRVHTMLDRGWIEEVTGLLRSGIPHNAKPFDFIGYSELRSHLEGTVTLTAATKAISQATRRYAKRQLTWFRKEPLVHWLPGFGDDPAIATAAEHFVAGYLNAGAISRAESA